MIHIHEILSYQTSFQKDVFSDLSRPLRLEDVLNSIKNEVIKDQVSRLRSFLNGGDTESYSRVKKLLPAVTFCGTFETKRRKENLTSYNSLIVLDIDKLSEDELHEVKHNLQEDKYVFSYWVSPSNKGVKGLVSIEFLFPIQNNEIDKIHKIAFRKLVEYFKIEYSVILDESGSDTSRLCFLSSDPDLVLKNEVVPFKVGKEDIEKFKPKKTEKSHTPKSPELIGKNALYNSTNRNSPKNRKTMQSIYKFLSKRKLSITSSYENWYKVGLAIASSFTYDIGEKYFLNLCRLDGDKHDEQRSKNLLLDCYQSTRGEVTFKTVYYLANKLGYKKQLESGSEDE